MYLRRTVTDARAHVIVVCSNVQRSSGSKYQLLFIADLMSPVMGSFETCRGLYRPHFNLLVSVTIGLVSQDQDSFDTASTDYRQSLSPVTFMSYLEQTNIDRRVVIAMYMPSCGVRPSAKAHL